ncbi:hypothetical protein [Arthrobacter sp. Leaf141]|uniref:hypothetical protein n=1 Tax=Arthrobacter sp. Leaf141 TaxID=1736273 RepID=UPI0012F757E4|nr:hypothetical protein [Arthrobacter sp. Leaf141]
MAESLGDASRRIAHHRIGGLVLTGREIPRSAAAGAEEFDAGRLYIGDRHLPFRDQSTTALLLGLRHHTINAVLRDTDPDEHDFPRKIWAELQSRDFPIAQAAAAGLSLPLARAAASRATLNRLTSFGLVGSAGLKSAHIKDPWAAFLTEIQPSLSAGTGEIRAGTSTPALLLPGWLSDLDRDGAVSAAISSDEVLRVAFGPGFVYRLSQWFGRLLTDDPDQVFNASVPDRRLFLGLENSLYTDETGDWFWTRLTQTALEDWLQSALVLEWSWQAQDDSRGMSHRILQERALDPDVVSRACLNRLTSGTPASGNFGFDPTLFVNRAIELLSMGDAEGAADIFSGLTELRPTDADVWNNLGFCQMALDPAAALNSLGRSAIFSRETSPVRMVNQVLALHLMGLDEDALILASETSNLAFARSSAWLWNHTMPQQAGRPMPNNDISEYLVELIQHIKAGGCGSGMSPLDE